MLIRCALFSILLVSPAFAAETDPLQVVIDGFRQVQTSKAHFVEHKTLAMLTQPLESTGTLSYTAPDRLEKITLTPAPETFTITGQTLTIAHDGQSKTLSLDDTPQIAALVESVRALLAGDLAKLQSLYDIDFDGNVKSWQILLQPKDLSIRKLVSSIRLTGTGHALHDVETVEGDGDKSDMVITGDAP